MSVNIKKKYKNFVLDIHFNSNERCLGILGASGCGKSLTLKCIAGIVTPEEGKIVLNGKVLFDSKLGINIPPQQRKIGLLFQNYALFPNMTVRENIGISCNKKNRKSITDRLLKEFRLNQLESRYPGQLSGGEQQRVAMARILAYDPEALLLDEPFSALDSYLKEELQQNLIDFLRKFNKDILMVSHSRGELYRFCDYIAVIDHGSLMETGNKRKIFEDPEKFITARLTGCRNISRAIRISDYEVRAIDWSVNLHTNKRVEDNIRYVGIQSCYIKPGEQHEENTIPINLSDSLEGPDQVKFVLTKQEDANYSHNSNLLWTVAKQEWRHLYQLKFPEYIQIPKEHILLLTESEKRKIC
nr:ATP-binding cassette domain-containing protein [Mobilitalea sibirica]